MRHVGLVRPQRPVACWHLRPLFNSESEAGSRLALPDCGCDGAIVGVCLNVINASAARSLPPACLLNRVKWRRRRDGVEAKLMSLHIVHVVKLPAQCGDRQQFPTEECVLVWFWMKPEETRERLSSKTRG